MVPPELEERIMTGFCMRRSAFSNLSFPLEFAVADSCAVWFLRCKSWGMGQFCSSSSSACCDSTMDVFDAGMNNSTSFTKFIHAGNYSDVNMELKLPTDIPGKIIPGRVPKPPLYHPLQEETKIDCPPRSL